ncbi:hypothetical protein [Geitlerinema sp. PCC 9228]|jgi:tetratricopeptide (TPR) repeat protein|uniref:hypothetical protein n=1 Tax=Geitlerinema sp. PCC 9228 TaxID=111611 RepID=UPI0008F9DD77|nr:hypothetical protein [Geitlerinema sp. PCC 9228]
MPRLNQRALDILRQEIKKQTKDAPVGKVQRNIALKRLEKLHLQQGNPVTEADLRYLLEDVFPNFDRKVLRRAARANRPPRGFHRIKWATIGITTVVGGIFILNLPYPFIRNPVSKVAPILLLPSYASMDYNYRQAIASVEQADQLVNQATSEEDIQLGAEKVTKAQGHLDRLPVWFLGYQPRAYCTLMGCTWKFTFDEFKQARARVGRMKAVVFQEQNAQKQLEKVLDKLEKAKKKYHQVEPSTSKRDAIATWKTAIDELRQVPKDTLAGAKAREYLQAQQRDLAEVISFTQSDRRSSALIQAAKAFGMKAAQAAQNPPHAASQWQRVANLWQEAIRRLQQVPEASPGYGQAQQTLATYIDNLEVAKMRWQQEKASVAAMEEAQRAIATWQQAAARNPNDPSLQSQLQQIINKLETIKPGTTVYNRAQTLLASAKQRMEG